MIRSDYPLFGDTRNDIFRRNKNKYIYICNACKLDPEKCPGRKRAHVNLTL